MTGNVPANTKSALCIWTLVTDHLWTFLLATKLLCTVRDELSLRPHRHRQQERARLSWWSLPSGPSRHQQASLMVDQRLHHRHCHQAPRHRHRSPRLRDRLHLPLHPRRLQHPWPWCAWPFSLELQVVRRNRPGRASSINAYEVLRPRNRLRRNWIPLIRRICEVWGQL